MSDLFPCWDECLFLLERSTFFLTWKSFSFLEMVALFLSWKFFHQFWHFSFVEWVAILSDLVIVWSWAGWACGSWWRSWCKSCARFVECSWRRSCCPGGASCRGRLWVSKCGKDQQGDDMDDRRKDSCGQRWVQFLSQAHMRPSICACAHYALCGCVFCLHSPSNCRYYVPAIRNCMLEKEQYFIHCLSSSSEEYHHDELMKKKTFKQEKTQPSQGKKNSKSLSKWKNIDPLKKKKTPSQQGKKSLIPEKKETQFYHKNRNLNTLTRKKTDSHSEKIRPAQKKRKETQLSLSLKKKKLSWENQAPHPQEKNNSGEK